MKKDKKGFTLVELLAVIVVLAIIMSIAGSAVLNQRKKANFEEAKKMEQDIETIGMEVYLEKKQKNESYIGEYGLSILTEYGLKSSTIKNPGGNGNCEGYLEVLDGPEFVGHICCPGVYETSMEDYKDDAPTDCGSYIR